jgi:hypothetical protein
MKKLLTSASVAGLSLPARKNDRVVWDSKLVGFGVRLRPGKTTWIVQYRIGVRPRRHTLGDVRTINADIARKSAKERLAQAQLGHDPQAAKIEARAKSAITLGSKVEIYLASKNSKSLRKSQCGRGVTCSLGMVAVHLRDFARRKKRWTSELPIPKASRFYRGIFTKVTSNQPTE